MEKEESSQHPTENMQSLTWLDSSGVYKLNKVDNF